MNHKMLLVNLIKKHIELYPNNKLESKIKSLCLKIDDFNVYINPLRLTRGNVKLKNIYIFDLPSGEIKQGGSCRNCSVCSKTCYALQQQLQYKEARIFRLINLYLMNYNPNLLLSLIENELKKSKNKLKTFRIHSSGEFFDQNEINFWDNFIKSHPEINFYAYTKVDKLSDFSSIQNNSNFNLIKSLIQHNNIKYRNYGNIKYVCRIAEKTGGFICPATVKGSDIKCNKGCNYCIKNDKVLFVIHGKGVKNIITNDDKQNIIKINRKLINNFSF